MLLSTLPPELELNIVEFLDPISTFHFALTSTGHSLLCKDHLREHARLSTKYSVIQPVGGGTHVWDFAKQVILDPRKGWYVRELNLVSYRPATHENMTEEDETLYRGAAEKIIPLYTSGRTFFAIEPEHSGAQQFADSMYVNIAEHFEDPVIVILIHHLPRLHTFRMTDDLRGDSLNQFMRRVAAGYQDPALAPRMPLQHLKTVAIAHSDTEFSCSVDWAVYFMCVPSLRTFAAFMMGSEHVSDMYDDGENSEAHLRNIADAPVSNVEEIIFHNCQCDPETLETLLPMCKNLKKLDYNAGGHAVAYQDFEPRKVIKAVATHVGHSLEELTLTESEIGFEEGEDDIPFASAREFKKLKALHCETRWLLPLPNDDLGDDEELSEGFHTTEDPAEKLDDPRSNLPESLEYLFLDGVYKDGEWDQLVEMFGSRNESTPKLTWDNTCIHRSTAAWDGHRAGQKHGKAEDPEIRFGNPLHDDLWKGHGQFY